MNNSTHKTAHKIKHKKGDSFIKEIKSHKEILRNI